MTGNGDARVITLIFSCYSHVVAQAQLPIKQHISFYKKSNKMQQCVKFLLVHIYIKFNMFRATQRPSSGALNCTNSLWFCIRGMLLDVWLLDAVSVQQPHVQQPSTYAKPEAVSSVLGS
jgi:hypothetical protein